MTARAGLEAHGVRRRRVPWAGLLGTALAVAATAGCDRKPSQPQQPRVAAEVPAGTPAPSATAATSPEAATPGAPTASQIAR